MRRSVRFVFDFLSPRYKFVQKWVLLDTRLMVCSEKWKLACGCVAPSCQNTGSTRPRINLVLFFFFYFYNKEETAALRQKIKCDSVPKAPYRTSRALLMLERPLFPPLCSSLHKKYSGDGLSASLGRNWTCSRCGFSQQHRRRRTGSPKGQTDLPAEVQIPFLCWAGSLIMTHCKSTLRKKGAVWRFSPFYFFLLFKEKERERERLVLLVSISGLLYFWFSFRLRKASRDAFSYDSNVNP